MDDPLSVVQLISNTEIYPNGNRYSMNRNKNWSIKQFGLIQTNVKTNVHIKNKQCYHNFKLFGSFLHKEVHLGEETCCK
jgi:hypothetical protein